MYCGTNSVDACCGTSVVMGKSGVKNAIAFVFGIAAASTLLGVIAALSGRVVGQLGSGFRYAIAFVPLIMALHLLGWVRVRISTIPQQRTLSGWVGAFGAGFLLSLALTPCGTPVLASVLSYVAYKASVFYGASLLFFYGFGYGVPVMLVGTTAGRLTSKLEKEGYGLWAEISGTALLALGLFLIWRA
jgi:cytochrome c biogenesis protein CcdA